MTTIIGIDCAAQPENTGLALGQLRDGALAVSALAQERDREAMLATLSAWIPAAEPALLAIDAPLGWPAALGDELAGHTAGAPLTAPPNAMFRRATDDFVKRHIGKQPLDVGADRIARAAHAALALLDDLGRRAGARIPLAFEPAPSSILSAIEIYPAATLLHYGISPRGYKKAADIAGRRRIIDAMTALMTIPGELDDTLLASADQLDAAICLLAGADFLRGRCAVPEDRALAAREGWIWVPR
ncbi:MAG: DUF429 domain-containing protein [Gammaproteobacteria bacterium]|nr:DUF429 domain-containing protein [Gammaproteobacteria bacterium]NNM01708.1 DUF429 domain-containing protein [Gammaproteobacteria bacterium]